MLFRSPASGPDTSDRADRAGRRGPDRGRGRRRESLRDHANPRPTGMPAPLATPSTSFSAMKAEGFPKAVKDTGKKTIMIFGVESHVCMMQTSFDLLAAGYEVYVISDCCTSRRTDDHQEAMNRLGAAGATVTTYEAALFELLVTSESPDFKAISNIVK